MIKPSKSWQKHMLNGKPIINLMSPKLSKECWNIRIGMGKAHFIMPNRVVLLQDNRLFLFFYQHNQLHGYELT